jgi:transcriptional regulator of acetoin/glycerol metabolism
MMVRRGEGNSVDGQDLAAHRVPGDARRHFLSEGVVDPAGVSDDILRSWQRSSRSGADPERLALPYEPDEVDTGSRFCDVALPIMERFAALLEGSPTCLVLADRDARGVQTWVGDRALEPALDRIGARPGFRFSEDVVGTNGLGTPIETGRPITIGVGEHYVEALQSLACVGVPVRHPLTRRLEAVVDITAAFEDVNGLLMPLATEIAGQIEYALYERSSVLERILLAHFLAASRASSKGIVVVSPDLVMANGPATRLIDGIPHALLWEHAAEVTRSPAADTRWELEGPDGAALQVRAAPLTEGDRVIGAVLELEREAAQRQVRRAERTATLPGLAGRGAAWRRLCAQLTTLAVRPGARLVLAGEAGTGKRAAALAALGDGVCLDGALELVSGTGPWIAALRAHLCGDRPVILTHLECLSGAGVRAAAAVLDASPPTVPFAATLVLGERPVTHCAPLLARLAHVEVPPLRHRPEDIPDLAAALLARLAPGRRCGPETLRALRRHGWPGNARELETALGHAAAQRALGDVRVEDLPVEVRRGAPGRPLTKMEQAELDAILAALAAAGGNKVEAAATLGISRSTLYRKLGEFGLDRSRV